MLGACNIYMKENFTERYLENIKKNVYELLKNEMLI